MLRPPFIIEARCFVLGKTLNLSVVATSPVAPLGPVSGLLEPVAGELQGAAALGDRAHDVLRGPVRDLGVDLKGGGARLQ